MTAIDTAPAPLTAAAPRRATAWLVVGALVGALMVAQGAVSFAALLSRHTRTVPLDLPATSRLVVRVNGGNVDVVGADVDAITGTAHVGWSFSEPRITTGQDGDTVELSVSCGSFLNSGCDVGFELQVPAGTTVDVSTGAGDVSASGVHADVSLSTDGGTVSATGVVGDVTARAGAGDITVSRATGDLDLRTDGGTVWVSDSTAARVSAEAGAGDVTLDLAGDPQAVTAHTGGGAVLVTVPDTPDVAYLLDMHTGGGATSGSVRTDPDSPRTITASAGAGDVTVAYR